MEGTEHGAKFFQRPSFELKAAPPEKFPASSSLEIGVSFAGMCVALCLERMCGLD